MLRVSPARIRPCSNVARPRRNLLILKADGVFANHCLIHEFRTALLDRIFEELSRTSSNSPTQNVSHDIVATAEHIRTALSGSQGIDNVARGLFALALQHVVDSLIADLITDESFGRHESRRIGWCSLRRKELFIFGNAIASIMALQSRLKSRLQRRSDSRIGKADWPIFRTTAKAPRRHFVKEIESKTSSAANARAELFTIVDRMESAVSGAKTGSALALSAGWRCATYTSLLPNSEAASSTIRRRTPSPLAARPRRGEKNTSSLRRTPASASASCTPQKSAKAPVLWL
jgi:hypothetical protein